MLGFLRQQLFDGLNVVSLVKQLVLQLRHCGARVDFVNRAGWASETVQDRGEDLAYEATDEIGESLTT